MPTVMGVTEYARTYYSLGDATPTKAQENSVRRMCQDGRIKNAKKMGKRWFINCTAEWPELFPEHEPVEKTQEPVARKPIITADMRLGDALAVLLDALAGKEGA